MSSRMLRRQDYIINLVQSVIETIFFFNPFVLLTSSLIREERENCCDDMVIAKRNKPDQLCEDSCAA